MTAPERYQIPIQGQPAGEAERIPGRPFGSEKVPFGGAGLAIGQRHLAAEEGGGWADLEGVGAGLFGRRVVDGKTGAVDMLAGDIPGLEQVQSRQPKVEQAVEQG